MPVTGEPLTLRDPLGIGIVDNRIPAQALSPQALAFLDFVPLPNTAEGAFNFRSGESRSLSRQDSYLGRLDHNLASANLITARYVFNQTLEAGTPFWGADQRDNTARGQNVLLQYTRTLTPDRINQLRAGWNRLTDRESFGTTGRPEFDVAGRMGLPRVSRRPADFGPPAIALTGPDGLYDVLQLQREGRPRQPRQQRVPDLQRAFLAPRHDPAGRRLDPQVSRRPPGAQSPGRFHLRRYLHPILFT
jgi:hypothetical protein